MHNRADPHSEVQPSQSVKQPKILNAQIQKNRPRRPKPKPPKLGGPPRRHNGIDTITAKNGRDSQDGSEGMHDMAKNLQRELSGLAIHRHPR